MKKKYILKKLKDEKELFNSCLKKILKKNYIMISGGKTFFPLHELINNINLKRKLHISLTDERIVDQASNKNSNFYNLKKNTIKNKKISILSVKKNLSKQNYNSLVLSFEKKIPLKKIQNVFLSPGKDGHFASVFNNSKIVAESKNFKVVKIKNKLDRVSIKLDYLKKKKIYIVLNKKKKNLLNLIKTGKSEYPINRLIKKCKNNILIMYV